MRFTRTMETAKFDKGLKEDRNLDYGDSEFYDYKEVIGFIYQRKIFCPSFFL